MNERIKQLAMEAGAMEWGDSIVPVAMDIEKFVKLIVNECAEIVADIDGGECMHSRGLREHFGVE